MLTHYDNAPRVPNSDRILGLGTPHSVIVLKSALQRLPEGVFCTCPSYQSQAANLNKECEVCGCLLGDIDKSPSKDGA